MARNLLRGVLRLACFHSDGLRYFGATPAAFLNSLAPWIAFPLVGSILMLLGGGGRQALVYLLFTCVMLLTPPVLSERLAHFWRRDEAWLRYAVAVNWCQWVMPMLGTACVLGLAIAGLPESAAWDIALALLTIYTLALHWFLARRGLGISPLRAVVFVGIVNIGTGVLVIGPLLLGMAMNGSAR
jgi:hypothetical protein